MFETKEPQVPQRARKVVLCMIAAALLAAPAAAEGLATERQAVFARMLDAPADRALMLRYAQLSVALRDYEAAVSTLERLIDLEPGNATARLELATAYFALGNYPLAEYHLAAASASGALGPDQIAAANAYREAAAERDAPSRISGYVAAGVVSADGETGLALSGALDWRIDMGDANATDWVTEMAVSSYLLDSDAGADAGDRRSFRLRTGPELRLTGDAFGPLLQPYVELEAVRYPDASASDYDALSIGLAYQNPHTATLGSFADISVGWGEFRTTGASIDFHDIDIGLVYRLSRDAQMRLTGSFGSEESGNRDEDSHGLRLDYSHRFDGPASFGGDDWRAGGFASVDWRDITEAGTPRDETLSAGGLFLRAGLGGDLFVETRASFLDRDGANPASETVLSVQLGWEF
jgi:hypothetical protein